MKLIPRTLNPEQPASLMNGLILLSGMLILGNCYMLQMNLTMVFNYKVFSLAFLAVGFALISCEKKQESGKADIETISAISAARAEAFNNGDAGGIAKYFADSARLMPPGSPTLIGKAEVKKYYQAIFDQYETELESGYLEVEVSGDMAYGRGLAKVTLFDKSSGDTSYAESEYINILKRQADGSWKTTHDIWNSSE